MGFPVIFHLSLKPIHWSCWWRFCHHSPAMLTSVPAGDPNLARGDDGKHWALGDATRSSLNARETRVKRVSRKSGDVWCCRLFCNRRNRAKLNQRKLPRRHTGWSSCGKHCHIKKKTHEPLDPGFIRQNGAQKIRDTWLGLLTKKRISTVGTRPELLQNQSRCYKFLNTTPQFTAYSV